MFPRPGEHTLREEDILKTIEEQGNKIALVIFSGVQYYTGQWFPMESVTRAAKAKVGHISVPQRFLVQHLDIVPRLLIPNLFLSCFKCLFFPLGIAKISDIASE
jgi:selenocysteine lyase/cysteine desulfurase